MRLVYIHISKTGGTSLRAVLANAFGADHCSEPFVQSYMSETQATALLSHGAICGHISRSDQLKWFGARRVITVLREPIDRCLSFLHYVRSLPPEVSVIAGDAHRLSMEELIDTEEARINLNNTMVRQLGGHLLDPPTSLEILLERAKQTLLNALWVGRQETMKVDLARLSSILGCDLEMVRKNVTPLRPPAANESPEIVSRLRALNAYDVMLWEWAQSALFPGEPAFLNTLEADRERLERYVDMRTTEPDSIGREGPAEARAELMRVERLRFADVIDARLAEQQLVLKAALDAVRAELQAVKVAGEAELLRLGEDFNNRLHGREQVLRDELSAAHSAALQVAAAMSDAKLRSRLADQQRDFDAATEAARARMQEFEAAQAKRTIEEAAERTLVELQRQALVREQEARSRAEQGRREAQELSLRAELLAIQASQRLADNEHREAQRVLDQQVEKLQVAALTHRLQLEALQARSLGRLVARLIGLSSPSATLLPESAVETSPVVQSESREPLTSQRGVEDAIPIETSQLPLKPMTQLHHRDLSRTQSISAASNLNELLRYESIEFVQRAYLTLFKRRADTNGLEFYTSSLEQGVSKLEVLQQLSESSEGRTHRLELSGLSSALSGARLEKRRWIGILYYLLYRSPLLGNTCTLDRLMALHNSEFVYAAYTALLKRVPDTDGFNFYLAQLQCGVPKWQLLWEMSTSDESKSKQLQMPGLPQLVRLNRRARVPVAGAWLRRRPGVEGVSALEVRLRAVEQRLFAQPPAKFQDTKTQFQAGAAAVTAVPTSASVGTRSTAAKRDAPPLSSLRNNLTQTPESRSSTAAASRRPSHFHGRHDSRALGPPLVWQIDETAGPVQAPEVFIEPMTRALLEVGHRTVLFSPTSTTADLTACTSLPAEPQPATAGTRLLVGYDGQPRGHSAPWVDKLNLVVDGVACTTRHAMKDLEDRGAVVPLAAVGLGVDHWERIVAANDYKAAGKRFRFLHASTCGPDSGVDLLVESFSRLFDGNDDVSLVIAAFGAAPNELLTQIKSLQKSDPCCPDVLLIENTNLSDGQSKALFEQCNVYVSPSRAEGFGLPIAFSFLSGSAVVATAWGGHLDYCDDSSAWLVDFEFQRARSADDPVMSIWAEPIASELDVALWSAYTASEAERSARSQAGRHTLMERFKWKDVAARMATFANEVKRKKVVA